MTSQPVELDHQIAALARAAADSGLPPLHLVDASEARRRSRLGAVNARPGPASLDVRDKEVAGVRVREYAGYAPDYRIIYAHGGGWVTGDLDTLDGFCRYLAVRLPAVVVSVDYRLAPEHPFPAAIDDFWAVVEALSTDGSPLPLVVAGDSAGANLAAVAARRARDRRNSPSLLAQFLAYPVTAPVTEGEGSYRVNAQAFPLGVEAMKWFWSHYAPDVSDDDADAYPSAAGDFAGMAPAFVAVAGHDPLCDEGLEYAERLRDAGVSVQVRDFPHLCHGFLRMDAASEAAAAAMDTVISEFRSWLLTIKGGM